MNRIHTAFPLLVLAAATSVEGYSEGGGSMSPINMENISIRINGVADIKYQQAADIESYDALARKKGAALAAANQKQLFHGSYGDIRAVVADKLSAAKNEDGTPTYGAPRLTIGSKRVTRVDDLTDGKVTGFHFEDDKGKTYKSDSDVKTEADKAFFDRVCAEQGVEASHFRDLIQTAADENPFNPSRKERSSGPRKIAKTYIATAEEIIKNGAGQAVADIMADKLDRAVDVTGDPESALYNLALAISDNEARERKEREENNKNKYLNMAGAAQG